MIGFVRSVLLATSCLLVGIISVQGQSMTGVYVTCPNGQAIENGVEVVVNMRPGYTYTATAVGISGFDPVLAVVDRSGGVLCSDDAADAATYGASLPTTGTVPPSSLSAQMPFSHNYAGMEDISLIVGGFNASTGQFLLILEGMAVTDADGWGDLAGDPYSLHITPNVIASGVDPTIYAIATTSRLDPLMRLVEPDGRPAYSNTGTLLSCDDAGTNTCVGGETINLQNSYVARAGGRQLPGGRYDAAMTLPIATGGFDPMTDEMVDLRVTSYQQNTYGDYVMVFHMGTRTAGAAQRGPAQAPPTPAPPSQDSKIYGVQVTCPNGQRIENGVEVLVNMRPGYDYTATVLGIGGFDPILAISDPSGNVMCADDSSEAASYTANLPTSGQVNAASLNPQMPFWHNYQSFEDISLVVGGYGASSGQFLLVLEGMAVTEADGSGPTAGDPFALHITPNLLSSGIDPTIYAIAVTNRLDPFIQVMDVNGNPMTDTATGTPLACDDAGSAAACWGVSVPLTGYYVSRSGSSPVAAYQYDAMLQLPLSQAGLNPFTDDFVNFKVTSYQQTSFGDYIVVFHLATGAAPAAADL